MGTLARNGLISVKKTDAGNKNKYYRLSKNIMTQQENRSTSYREY